MLRFNPWSGSWDPCNPRGAAKKQTNKKGKNNLFCIYFNTTSKKAFCVLASLPAQPLLALRSCPSDISVLYFWPPLNSPPSPGFYICALLLSAEPSSSSSRGPFPALTPFPHHSELGRRQLGIIALQNSALGIHSRSKSSPLCPFYLQWSSQWVRTYLGKFWGPWNPWHLP